MFGLFGWQLAWVSGVVLFREICTRLWAVHQRHLLHFACSNLILTKPLFAPLAPPLHEHSGLIWKRKMVAVVQLHFRASVAEQLGQILDQLLQKHPASWSLECERARFELMMSADVQMLS